MNNSFELKMNFILKMNIKGIIHEVNPNGSQNKKKIQNLSKSSLI